MFLFIENSHLSYCLDQWSRVIDSDVDDSDDEFQESSKESGEHNVQQDEQSNIKAHSGNMIAKRHIIHNSLLFGEDESESELSPSPNSTVLNQSSSSLTGGKNPLDKYHDLSPDCDSHSIHEVCNYCC